MKKFFDYSKNRFLYSFLKLAILLIIGIILSGSYVKADIVEYKFIDYVSTSSTLKRTNFSANDEYTYTRDYVLFNGNERFFAFSYCATGRFDFSFPNDFEGITSRIGYYTGGSCSVQGYQGFVYTVYFVAQQVNDAGNGNLSIMFNTKVINTESYNVFIDVLSLTSVDSIPAGVQIPNYDGDFNTLNTKIDSVDQALEEVKKAQTEQTNEQKKTNDLLTDDTSPDLDYDSMLGWLPQGPLDSLLNLPLTFFNSMLNGLGKKCIPVNVPIPYVDKNYQLPCITSLYAKIEGFGTFWENIVGGVAGVLILFSYLLKLYKWVDDTLTYRENNHIDNWGGV